MHLHIQLSIITSEIYAPGQIIQKHKNLHTALTVYNWNKIKYGKWAYYYLSRLLFDNLPEKVWLRSH